MFGYIVITTYIHVVRKNTMVRPCLVTSLTSPTSTLFPKQWWSGHVRLHASHQLLPPCPPKTNGPAMCGYIVITTYIHVFRKNTMVRPCPVTSLTSPTCTLCTKIQWSGHVRLHPLHHNHPPSPQKGNGPAMSAHILITTYIHVVRKNTMVRPCPATFLKPPTSTLSPNI